MRPTDITRVWFGLLAALLLSVLIAGCQTRSSDGPADEPATVQPAAQPSPEATTPPMGVPAPSREPSPVVSTPSPSSISQEASDAGPTATAQAAVPDASPGNPTPESVASPSTVVPDQSDSTPGPQRAEPTPESIEIDAARFAMPGNVTLCLSDSPYKGSGMGHADSVPRDSVPVAEFEICLSDFPKLGEEVDLVARVVVPETVLEAQIDHAINGKNLQIVSGDLRWEGVLIANEPKRVFSKS